MGNKSDLKDGYFLGRSCTDIIADLAAGVFSLAGISALQIKEQERIGWIDAMKATELYTLTSAGVWIANKDAYGGPTSLNGSIHNGVKMQQNGRFGAPTTLQNGAYGDYFTKRYGYANITLDGAGAASNQALMAAIAGYKACIEIRGICAPASEATTTVVFQDEDDTTMPGTQAAGYVLNLVASTINTQIQGLVSQAPASKAVECDVSGGTAAGTLQIFFIYWYET